MGEPMKVRHYPEMPEIVVSQVDQQRLTVLAMDALNRSPDVATELIAEMERARVVPDVPPSVVQMGSIVTYKDDDNRERRAQLVFLASGYRRGENFNSHAHRHCPHRSF